MQALVRVQARVRARRVRMSAEGQAVQKHLWERRNLDSSAHPRKSFVCAADVLSLYTSLCYSAATADHPPLHVSLITEACASHIAFLVLAKLNLINRKCENLVPKSSSV